MIEIKWAWEHLKGYRLRYILGYILHITLSLLVLINPNIVRRIIDEALFGGDTSILLPLAATMVAVTFSRTLIGYSVSMLIEFSATGFVYNMRRRMYDCFQAQDMQFFSNNTAGDLMTAMTSDMDMIRHNIAFVFRHLISGAVLFVGVVTFYLLTNWQFALCILALTPAIFIITFIYGKRVRNIYIELRRRRSLLSTSAQENIEANRVVKAFANETFEINKFNERNSMYREQNLLAQRTWLKYFPYVEGLAQSMMITVLLFGGIFLIRGDLTAGEYMAFSSLSWAVTDPLRQLGVLINDMQHFFASSMRMMTLLGTRPSVVSPQDPEAPVSDNERTRGEIEFQNVEFGFGRTKVLEDINFHIRPGETYALMGETGSGKTVIADLITRFYDVKRGAVLIDGVDVKKWNLRALRSSIGMTTQETFLFSDTVDGNIAYGDPELPEEDVKKFAEISAAQFVDTMAEGYDTIIGERGVGLSGGQKQRIALARALAVRPSILILDDTTSAVDMETEKYIQEQLALMEMNCTKLIIAQRISSVKKADCILLIHEGKIAERGTHQELLALRGMYFDLWRIQTGADELQLI
jgi:ATP-binding cassette subfamily B protein